MVSSTICSSIPGAGRRIFTLPDFLIPCLARGRPTPQLQLCTFSTSSARSYPRDRNRDRGVSAIRRTGLRQPLSVSKYPLPKPVLDPAKRSKPTGDADHGLWGFFNDEKTALATPKDDFAHGLWPRSTLICAWTDVIK